MLIKPLDVLSVGLILAGTYCFYLESHKSARDKVIKVCLNFPNRNTGNSLKNLSDYKITTIEQNDDDFDDEHDKEDFFNFLGLASISLACIPHLIDPDS